MWLINALFKWKHIYRTAPDTIDYRSAVEIYEEISGENTLYLELHISDNKSNMGIMTIQFKDCEIVDFTHNSDDIKLMEESEILFKKIMQHGFNFKDGYYDNLDFRSRFKSAKKI